MGVAWGHVLHAGKSQSERGSNWPKISVLAFRKWCSRPRTSKGEPVSEWCTGRLENFILS